MRATIHSLLVLLCALGVAAPIALSDTSAPVGPGDADTPYTPVAKPTALWTQVAGAVYPGATPSNDYHPAESPTRAIDDLYAVGFRNPSLGFAGGAACENPGDPVATCARHPVVYRYSDTDGSGPQWRLDTTFPAGGRGFVGAIAYIPHTDKFLAVGGDGCYPRRELDCPAGAGPPASDADPIAGDGRAWLFENGAWRELTPEPGMRGMTALDFTSIAAQFGYQEYGVAGALGQLWMWRDGGFTGEKIDKDSANLSPPPMGCAGIFPGCKPFGVTEVSAATDPTVKSDFRYRVRDIRAQLPPSGMPLAGLSPRFFAVTAGCCNADPASAAPGQGKGRAVLLADTGDRWTVAQAGGGSDPRLVSAYAVGSIFTTTNNQGTAIARNYLLNADGPESAAEPPSSFESLGSQVQPDPIAGGMRLVSADGLVRGNGAPYDWYVGVDRGTGHGVAYGTGAKPSQPQGGVCAGPATDSSIGNGVPSCTSGDVTAGQQPSVDAGQEQAALQSYRLVDLGTYPLNAFRKDGGETSGGGWAVGDRGAIVELGEAVPQAGTEPEPPSLAATGSRSFGDTTAYDAFRPLVTGLASGGVPALSAQPLDPLTRPVPVAGGSPNPAGPFTDVSSIAMSRDGSEGWAVGGSSGLALYHYDGTRWSRCDPIGAPPLIPPDPSCAGLHDLAGAGLHLLAAARVPRELGGDPSRADDFEVVAVGSYQPTPGALRQLAIVRYSEGAWRPEDSAATSGLTKGAAVSLDSVAFAAPDDGWAASTITDSNSNTTGAPLYHFDGTHWVECLSQPGACDASPGQLPSIRRNDPAPQRGLRFTAVGRRVYLSGARVVETQGFSGTAAYPLILHHDPGGHWTSADGGYDPGAGAAPQPGQQGIVASLAVAPDGHDADGRERYTGWAVGEYGGNGRSTLLRVGASSSGVPQVPDAGLLRLEDGSWTPYHGADASQDYLAGIGFTDRVAPVQLAPGPTAFGSSLIAAGPLLGFDGRRWRIVPAPVQPNQAEDSAWGAIQALAADGHGGFWLAAGAPDPSYSIGAWFYHYGERARRPVFTDAPHPLQRPITALAGAADGTVWAATNSDLLARYDRLTGWDTIRIPGWDPGRLVTASSPVNAIALGADGTGLAVGTGGRIADLAGSTVKLDRAAGAALCELPPAAPVCGTGRSLRAAAVAPDGSALVGGDALALLWRPPGGDFLAVSKPPAAAAARITGIALPSGDRAWLSVSTGQVFAGTLEGRDWSWRLENTSADGDLLSNDSTATALGLRGLALDASGRGFAVGDRGLVLERDPSRGAHPWRRLETGFADDLTGVALPAGSGAGALIGGANGLVLTLADGRFEVAHAANRFGAEGKPVVGLALLPGVAAGQTEAWAALSDLPRSGAGGSGSALLHYASDPSEPLLNAGERIAPLPDAPAPRDGEIVFAAFGKSDCHVPDSTPCSEMTGTQTVNEVVAGRVVQAIAASAGHPGGPLFAVYSGDVDDSAGGANVAAARQVSRFAELVLDGLRSRGVPAFGAIGGQDLSAEFECTPATGCVSQKQTPAKNTGANLPWRQALADRPRPWGDSPEFDTGALRFESAPGQQEQPGASDLAPLGGARTHYAVDVVDGGDRKLARLVFVDTSLRSLGGADATQNPVEPSGGQQGFLQRMLCVEGSAADTGQCTRPGSERALVVSETPAYSYGPGAGSDVESDGAAFESTLLANHADVVVSGRIGWNALYYTLAAGLHSPCPGGSYPADPPQTVPNCASQQQAGDAAGKVSGAEGRAGSQLAATLDSLGAPRPPVDPTGTIAGSATGLLPTVIASGAGGKLADPSAAGSWYGYTLVRVDGGADPYKTIVEQRPVFDWVQLTAPARRIQAGQRMQLRGIGREPLSVSEPARVDRIDSPAITHRYDLLEADPLRPWLPKVVEGNGNPNGYVPLDPSVATVDDQSGKVVAQRGNHGRVYAIAELSAGDQAATYPLVFEPKASYRPPRAQIVAPPPVPAVRVLGLSQQALQTPPPAPPPAAPPSFNPNLTLPSPPSLPVFPTASAPPIAPPAPPAPPPPPPAKQGVPLDLSVTPVGIAVPPTPGVSAQPTPPVQPAPPSGARREAKQRQAATAKSEEESGQGARQEAAGNEPHPFTALHDSSQPSAWVTGLEWGGGIGLMALALALGFVTVRPTPRRRSRGDATPAPAYARRSRND